MSHRPAGAPDQPRYRAMPHVLAASDGARTVLLDPARGRYYSLDEVGGRVWALLEDGAGVEALAHRLAEEYDAPPDAIRADVLRLLGELGEAGLVRAG